MTKWLLAGLGVLIFAGGLRADDLPGLKEPLRTVVQKYLVVQQKLAGDTFDGVTAAATEMKTAMAAAPAQTFTDDFAQAVDDLVAAKDLHAARLAFHPLSNEMIAALAMAQVQTGSLHSVFCPMIKAYWVQTDGHTVHNPYYGASMPDCGEIQRQF
jgi:hypothetical protein